jgi:hypothetical protein
MKAGRAEVQNVGESFQRRRVTADSRRRHAGNNPIPVGTFKSIMEGSRLSQDDFR